MKEKGENETAQKKKAGKQKEEGKDDCFVAVLDVDSPKNYCPLPATVTCVSAI